MGGNTHQTILIMAVPVLILVRVHLGRLEMRKSWCRILRTGQWRLMVAGWCRLLRRQLLAHAVCWNCLTERQDLERGPELWLDLWSFVAVLTKEPMSSTVEQM